MRTKPSSSLLFCEESCSTRKGRSGVPDNGAQGTAEPSEPATDVNVPHSCTTRSPVWPPSRPTRYAASASATATPKSLPAAVIPSPPFRQPDEFEDGGTTETVNDEDHKVAVQG